MKKVFFAVCAALFLAACGSRPALQEEQIYDQQGPEEVGTYTVSVIDKNVYHLEDFNSAYGKGTQLNDSGKVVGMNNCSDMYLVVGSKAAVLIDLSNEIKWADNGIESLQKAVADRIGNLPLTITITHNHGDHLGMLAAFTGNPDVQFVLPRVDFESPRMMALFPEQQVTLFDEGYEFDLGDKKLKTLMVPGHTPGSMVYFVEGANICFTGDAIGSGQGVWIFNKEGFLQYTQSIPKLMAYIQDPANGIDKDKLLIYGGHYHQRSGMQIEDGQEMGWWYLEETQELINQIGEGTAESVPVSFGMSLDAHFKYKNTGIVWNAAFAKEYQQEKQSAKD